MERTFDVTAIANSMLVIRGVVYKIGTQFEMRMTERELNGFKNAMNILECKEHTDTISAKEEPVVEVASESETVIDDESEELKPKEAKNGTTKSSGRKNQTKSKTTI